MALDYRNDEDQDRLNPGSDKYALRRVHEQDQQDGFNQTAQQLLSQEKASNNQPPTGGNIGQWETNVSGSNSFGAETKLGWKQRVRRYGPVGGLVSILAGGLGLFSFFFGSALAPVAFMQVTMDDLNDRLATMDLVDGHVMRSRIPRGEVNDIIAGCQKLSFRCKLRTVSDVQIKRLAIHGIQVEGVPLDGNPNRIVPERYRYGGQSYTAEQMYNALRTRSPETQHLRNAYHRANNYKFLGLSDKTFVGRVLGRWSLSRKPVEMRGSKQDRIGQLITRAGVDQAADLDIVTITDDDGNEQRYLSRDTTINEDGVRVPRSGAVPIDPSLEDHINRQKQRIENANKPPSRMRGNAIRGLSVLGYADLACSVRNMMGAASVAAKIANAATLAEFSMNINSKVGELMAGDISPEDAEALQELFNMPDNRKQIPDINPPEDKSLFRQVGEGAYDWNVNEMPMIDNPNYGRTMMDTVLYEMSATGQVSSLTTSEMIHSLGVNQNGLLRSLSVTAEGMSNFAKIGDADGCRFVQNWFVRGSSMVIGVVAGVFSGGGTLVLQGLSFGAMFAAGMYVEHVLHKALANSGIDPDIQEAPVEMGAMLWGGNATLSQEAGRIQNGGYALGPEEFAVNNKYRQDSLMAYSMAEAEVADPLDVYSPYSAMGSLSRALMPMGRQTSSLALNVSNHYTRAISSIIPNITGFSDVSANVSAANRLGIYQDNQLSAVNIKPDVMGNIRFGLPSVDRALLERLQTRGGLNGTYGVDAVVEYMEQAGYIESDSESPFPAGYTPPQPAEAENFVQGMLSGAASTLYNNRDHGDNNYAWFLDHCVYRVAPFGPQYTEEPMFGSTPTEWETGAQCQDSESEEMSYFRLYNALALHEEATNEALPLVEGSGASAGGGGTVAPGERPDNTEPIGKGWRLINGQDYSRYTCANGTTDKGVYTNAGNGTTIRLCELEGENVASIVSQQLVDMFAAAKAEGINMSIVQGGGHRTYEYQQDLFNRNCVRLGPTYSCKPPTAVPGTSNHEGGIAIDVTLDGSTICYTTNPPPQHKCPGNAAYEFLKREAASYGFYKLPQEAWHWEPLDWGSEL